MRDEGRKRKDVMRSKEKKKVGNESHETDRSFASFLYFFLLVSLPWIDRRE